jgi:putative flippase GtrA
MRRVMALIRDIWEVRVIRFLVVGGLNTLFGYGVFALLLFLGLHYSVALLVATVLGVLFNFKTTGVIVFKNSSNRLILRFILVYGVVYGLNVLSVHTLKKLGMSGYVAGAVLLIPMAMVAYALNHLFVFSPERS